MALATELNGCQNTVVGAGAMDSSVGACFNTVVGYNAGTAISSGDNNGLFGINAGCAITTGCFNIVLGHGSGIALTTACCNVFVGGGSGCLSTGNSNTYLGDLAGCNNTTGTRNVVIGASGVTSTATVSNEVTIWNGVGGQRFTGAGAWGSISDARDKSDVEDLALGLEFIDELQPRKFKWAMRHTEEGNGKEASGFIAQEVLAVAEKYDATYTGLVDTNDPDRYMFAVTSLIPMLVNAVKELKAEVEALKAKGN
mgnify:CR=1 FL=1